MSDGRAERRFHQLAAAAWLGLALFMAWATAAAWIGTLAALALLAGSVSRRLSLTRGLYRWWVAPLRKGPAAAEDQKPFLQADALGGTLVLAGVVFVVAGAHTLGWALVGLYTAALLLDAMLDASPLRWAIARLMRS